MMKSKLLIATVILTTFLTPNYYSQTKKEKKVEVSDYNRYVWRNRK